MKFNETLRNFIEVNGIHDESICELLTQYTICLATVTKDCAKNNKANPLHVGVVTNPTLDGIRVKLIKAMDYCLETGDDILYDAYEKINDIHISLLNKAKENKHINGVFSKIIYVLMNSFNFLLTLGVNALRFLCHMVIKALQFLIHEGLKIADAIHRAFLWVKSNLKKGDNNKTTNSNSQTDNENEQYKEDETCSAYKDTQTDEDENNYEDEFEYNETIFENENEEQQTTKDGETICL